MSRWTTWASSRLNRLNSLLTPPRRRLALAEIGGLVLLLAVGWNLYLGMRLFDQQELATMVPYRSVYTTTTTTTRATVALGKDETAHPVPRRSPTHHACDGFAGVYHIAVSDELGGVGTAFFQLVLGQILYAHKHNLKPWVYFDDFSKVVYDPLVHGKGPGVHFRMQQGGNATYVHRKYGQRRDFSPGPPNLEHGTAKSIRDFHFFGTGIWEDYFEPVSDFVPGDRSCENKPYVTMELYLVTPGIHGYSEDYAARAWRYDYLPDYVTKPHMSYHEWFEPQRVRANAVMRDSIRVRPYLQEAAARVTPGCDEENTWCLGLHIRHSDKAAGREVLPIESFRPYVDAFFAAGGDFLYLATDSSAVLSTIEQTWPPAHVSKLRHLGSESIRSSNQTAVFDMASHHRTNVEILVEILALSRCQFLLHGLSAVSESALWININLHNQSVNLEDPDHISVADFGRVVTQVQAGQVDNLPQPPRTQAWWNGVTAVSNEMNARTTCDGYDGVLLISSVTKSSSVVADAVFSSSLLNQLQIAERYNLKPWVVFSMDESELLFDTKIHLTSTLALSVIEGKVDSDGCPSLSLSDQPVDTAFSGSNLWQTYMMETSFSQPPCTGKPIVWFNSESLAKMMESCPSAIRSRAETEASLWNPRNLAWNHVLRPVREVSSKLVNKYISFHPILREHAAQVNPLAPNQACLGVLMTDEGRKFKGGQYLPYLEAFARATDGPIYVATSSSRPQTFMNRSFPAIVLDRIRTQGRFVARSEFKFPLHIMDDHHRINSERLVDILALSKCQILLAPSSTDAEAAIYLNPSLANRSVILEDTQRLSPDQFTAMVKGAVPETLAQVKINGAMTTIPTTLIDNGTFAQYEVEGAKVLFRIQGRTCRRNAIVYLAQKKHQMYKRDSFGLLQNSLKLLRENYLAQGENMNNTDIFIFHTASFTANDLEVVEDTLGPAAWGAVRLVDLDGSSYWQRPHSLRESNPMGWFVYPEVTEGYRHMMQFFAIQIWKFFAKLNEQTSCSYRFIMRLDEESFIHSPIAYDLFDLMADKGYSYGYRMCSYEMQPAKRLWKRYSWKESGWKPKRQLNFDGCGFYNNFFVADLDFFLRPDVVDFLEFIYIKGHIYRWRLGDLLIHTMVVYGFAESDAIHRFLDFTYEHGTVSSKCLAWGGMQAGYLDEEADRRLDDYAHSPAVLSRPGCLVNTTDMTLKDLSPTYAHVPPGMENLTLRTVVAGKMEYPDKGILSG